jgi:hypothetical protein
MGLYGWRVEALDEGGILLGAPSDCSYLIRK